MREAAPAGGRKPWLPLAIGLGIPVIVVAGIFVLESRAEAHARSFCGTAIVGAPLGSVAEAAQTTGERLLRQVAPEKVVVGFTGLPPYSRHFCTVEGREGLVTRATYSTLD